MKSASSDSTSLPGLATRMVTLATVTSLRIFGSRKSLGIPLERAQVEYNPHGRRFGREKNMNIFDIIIGKIRKNDVTFNPNSATFRLFNLNLTAANPPTANGSIETSI